MEIIIFEMKREKYKLVMCRMLCRWILENLKWKRCKNAIELHSSGTIKSAFGNNTTVEKNAGSKNAESNAGTRTKIIKVANTGR